MDKRSLHAASAMWSSPLPNIALVQTISTWNHASATKSKQQNRIAVKSHVITAGTLVGRLIGYLMVEGSFFAVIVKMTMTNPP